MPDFIGQMAEKAKRLVKGAKNEPKRDATGPASQNGEGDSDYCGADSVVSVTDSIASTNNDDNSSNNSNKKKTNNNKDYKDSEAWVVVGRNKPIIGEAPIRVSTGPGKPRDANTSKAKATTHTEPEDHAGQANNLVITDSAKRRLEEYNQQQDAIAKTKTKAHRLVRDRARTRKMIERPEVEPRTVQGPAEFKKEKDKEAVTTEVQSISPKRKDTEIQDVESVPDTKEEAAMTDVSPKRKDTETQDVESVPETKEEADARARTGHDAHEFVWPK
ncbi:hypothetical protein GE09DRAFT_1285617 [Coniochaeta sp. 2T2.1]|nr:hypothetical protein GE09DRAFT_1285617 [Coniochaeta sp. 2T2.1]